MGYTHLKLAELFPPKELQAELLQAINGIHCDGCVAVEGRRLKVGSHETPQAIPNKPPTALQIKVRNLHEFLQAEDYRLLVADLTANSNPSPEPATSEVNRIERSCQSPVIASIFPASPSPPSVLVPSLNFVVRGT